MRKLILILALIFSVNCSKVPAGYVGVKVYLLGSNKGVDSEELKVGRYWISVNEELYLFPTFTKNYVWTKSSDEGSEGDESINIQTKEGLTVNADVGIQFRIDSDKVNEIFQKYRKGVDEITDIVLRNAVRDTLNQLASNMTSETIYGAGRVDLIEKTTEKIIKDFTPSGIIVEKIYWTGDMRLPPKIKEALDSKIEAIQRSEQRENELREAVAQAKIDEAKAKGTALKIEMESKQLTPMMIQKIYIEKWDGKLPQYIMGGNTLNQMSFGAIK